MLKSLSWGQAGFLWYLCSGCVCVVLVAVTLGATSRGVAGRHKACGREWNVLQADCKSWFGNCLQFLISVSKELV